jgi:Ni2+-binding GTPase involved in maturation of urease and hydrogenase
MIPLVLVTGFLGSGKTTLLRRIAERNENRRYVFLVNEFSDVDVDGHTLRDLGDSVHALPGGSIFCKCLVTEFISAMGAIPREHPDVETVIVEASGIANPMVIEKMLSETSLDQVFALTSVICVIDPGTFPTLTRTLPNILAQVEASDLVIINKTDLFTEEQIQRTEDEVLRIRPDASVRRAVNCDVQLDLFGGRGVRGLEGEYAKCVDPNYLRIRIPLPNGTDLSELRGAIKQVENVAYRIKGYVIAGGEVCHVDFSRAGLMINAAHGEIGRSELVAIFPGQASAVAMEFVARISPRPARL